MISLYRYIPLLLLILVWQLPSTVLASNKINEIRYVGNHKTRVSILNQELVIKVGDPLDRSLLEQSRQNIMDLGLFKSVKLTVEPGGVVIYTIKEKRYLLVIPRFSRDKKTDKITPGAKLQIDNIGGLNQKLKLVATRSDPENADHGYQNEFGLNYSYPKVGGSLFNIDFSTSVIQTPHQLFQSGVPVSDYDRQDIDTRLIVSRWFDKVGPSHGWLAGLGARYQQRSYQYQSGLTDSFNNDQAVSLLGQVFYTNVRDHLYSRTGLQYGYTLEQGMQALGSDYDYNRHLLFYRHYIRLGRPHYNLNVQARFGFSSGFDSNLMEDVYDIAGYGDLRAHSDIVSGDTFVLLNVEYLQPVFDSKQVRALLFTDIGNAYASVGDIDLGEIETTVGLGLRWRVKSFVDLSLSLEYAIDVNSTEDKVYLRTKGAF